MRKMQASNNFNNKPEKTFFTIIIIDVLGKNIKFSKTKFKKFITSI